jgi:hypothetical protein
MKKLLYLLLISGSMFLAGKANAQFRSIPGVVTDSFKIRYPDAADVKWSDKVSAFQAVFTLNKETLTARYNSKGEWLSATKQIGKDAIPGAVKDGLSKSQYAGSEWELRTVTVRYLPGNVTQYILYVYKGDFSKRNLTFSSNGQLLKDATTL